MDIVFVVESSKDAPARYRVSVPAAGLGARGVPVDVRHVADPDLGERLGRASHVVLFRVPLSHELATALSHAREQNPSLVVAYDIDDPLFDERFKPSEHEAYERAVAAADLMLGSTPEIHRLGARLIGDRAGEAVANGIHPVLAKRSRVARRMPRLPGRQRLGFMSGSGVHDQHWSSVEDSIWRVMGQLDLDLWVIGAVQSSKMPESVQGRVKRIPFMDWQDLPFWVRQMDLLLMPNSDHEWSANAKSHVKWLEAALVDTPVLATATEPYEAAISHGNSGFLVDHGERDWGPAIQRAMSANLKTVGQRARQEAVERFSAEQISLCLLTILRDARPVSRQELGMQGLGRAGQSQTVSLEAERLKPRLPLRLQARLLLGTD